RGAEDEAPSLGRRYDVDVSSLKVPAETLYGRPEGRGAGKQRRDVLEHDPWLGKIRDAANVVAQVDRGRHGHESTLPSRQIGRNPLAFRHLGLSFSGIYYR